MLVNNNDVQSINAALIELQKQIQQIQNELKKIKQLYTFKHRRFYVNLFRF